MSITTVEPVEDADLVEKESIQPMMMKDNRDPNNLNAHLQVIINKKLHTIPNDKTLKS